jgi:hypothetical protein
MPTARYSVTFGLSGCYMPDSGPTLFTCRTRQALADVIRGELAIYAFPKSAFRQAGLKALWSFITKAGDASRAHFYISYKGNTLAFTGLTKAEAKALDAAEGR